MTTQNFKLVPVEPTPESVVKRLLDNGPKPVDSPHWTSYNRAIADWREYLHAELAMLEARRIVEPRPPKLSDERILEIWASNSGRPVTMGKARIIAQARAIEREILGAE